MEVLLMPLEWTDWLQLFAHYALVSLLSFGGVTTATPDLQRFLVEQHHWMTHAQFSAYFAIARASPGPNVLFVGLTGWAVGMNSGGVGSALYRQVPVRLSTSFASAATFPCGMASNSVSASGPEAGSNVYSTRLSRSLLARHSRWSWRSTRTLNTTRSARQTLAR